MPGRMPVVGLLVLSVVGHGRNKLCWCCGCTSKLEARDLEVALGRVAPKIHDWLARKQGT